MQLPACNVGLIQAAWLVLQTKVSGGSVSFNKTWNEYKNGFGNPAANDNYWIGNEKLYQLTSSGPGRLRVEVLSHYRVCMSTQSTPEQQVVKIKPD
jgi:Fibrinogen beta and gamma chains, C-terminal globular domain